MKTMNYISILYSTILVVFISTSAFSQQSVNAFDAAGIKVIHKTVPNEVVAVRLYVRGGTANYPKEKEGVENLAFEMALYGGTEKRTHDEFLQLADRLGMGLSAKTGYDYGYLGMTALKKYWDESWNLWTAAIASPAMGKERFEQIRDGLYSTNRRGNLSPEKKIDQLSMSFTYVGTDYEKLPEGTPESLLDITLEDIKKHYNIVLTKSNVFLVVVGNLTRADLATKVEAAFGSLPPGEAAAEENRTTVRSPGVTIQHQDLEINHIQGRMPAPDRFSTEGVDNMLAMSLLSDRMADKTRDNYDLFYAPSAFAGNELRYPGNTIYVSTNNPVESAKVMVDAINRARKEGFTSEELEDKKSLFLTYHYLGQETLDAQAHALGDAEMNGDWRQASGLTADVIATNVDAVNAVMRKYATWINWTYLGNASQVQPADFPQPDEISDATEEEEKEVEPEINEE